MATLAYPYSVRDSANATTDNRKTGLTPTVSNGKTLAASPAAVLASAVSVVEVGAGDYVALYDAEANGDASFPVDWGASLSNPNDRYGTLVLTRDSGRALTALPNAPPGGASGLPILGTNTAGIALQPVSGDALRLAAAGGYALNASGSTGSRLAATGAGQSAVVLSYLVGNYGIVGDIRGNVYGGVNILFDGAASAATPTTLTLAAGSVPSTAAGSYVNCLLWVYGGPGVHQVRVITAHDVATGVVTVADAWATTPDASSTVRVLAAGPTSVRDVAAGALAGKGDWATAATPVTLADGAIKESTITAPAEAAGVPAGVLGWVRRLLELAVNKRDRNSSTGVVTLYGADNTTVLQTETQSTVGLTDTISKAQ